MTGHVTRGVAEGRVRHGLKVSRGAELANDEDGVGTLEWLHAVSRGASPKAGLVNYTNRTVQQKIQMKRKHLFQGHTILLKY